MKSCPTCDRTYPDDAQVFCLMDGSVLSAPYDPAIGKEIQRPNELSPPATELITPTFEPRTSSVPKMGAKYDSMPARTGSSPATTIQASPPSVPPPPRPANADRVPAKDLERPVEIWDTEARRKVLQNKIRFVIFTLASLIFALLAAFTIEGSPFRLIIGVACALVFAGAAWRSWRAARSS